MNRTLIIFGGLLFLFTSVGALALTPEESFCNAKLSESALTATQRSRLTEISQILENHIYYSNWPASKREHGGDYMFINASRSSPPLAESLIHIVGGVAEQENLKMLVLRPNTPAELESMIKDLGRSSLKDADLIWVSPIAFDPPPAELPPEQMLKYGSANLGYGPWTAAWDQSLAVINGTRNSFLMNCKATIIFVLPPEFRGPFLVGKPDLFSFRKGAWDLNVSEGTEQ